MAEKSRGRPDADFCFVCGPENPIGLRIAFRIEGEVCRAEFTPAGDHQGFDGITHGGILYSALDDVMANWFFLRGVRAVTAKCRVRYLEPVPTGTPLRLESRMRMRKGRLAVLEGQALRREDGCLMTEAEGTYAVSEPGPEKMP